MNTTCDQVPDLDFGPPLKLATKRQLMLELIDRDDGYAVCACEMEDKSWDCAASMPPIFGDPPNVSEVFRCMAKLFEQGKNVPRPSDE